MSAQPCTAVVEEPGSEARAARVPLLLQAVLFGSTSILVGLIWDISWHRSIGRDTFWSPPHLAIYLGGIVAGLASAAAIFRATFGRAAAPHVVHVLGFRGPLGAFFCSWGAGAMITSAPFDDWWHNTYGLDVAILSPPHSVLALGVMAIQVGAMMAAVAEQNRAPEGERGVLPWLHIYAAGLMVSNLAILSYEQTFRLLMHRPRFYQVVAALYPLLLVASARASRLRFPATAAAFVYSALFALQVWVLPLIPAEPRLGPVRQPVDHMVPLQFPLMVMLPALALDLLLRRRGTLPPWPLAARLGTAFAVVFLLVQWPFASFLLSPFARNAVFGGHELPYFVSSDHLAARGLFLPWTGTSFEFVRGMLLALPLGIVSARLGLSWGDWMARVRR